MDWLELFNLMQLQALGSDITQLQKAMAEIKPSEPPLWMGLAGVGSILACLVSAVSLCMTRKTALQTTKMNNRAARRIAKQNRDMSRTIANSGEDLSREIAFLNTDLGKELEKLKGDLGKELKHLEFRLGNIKTVVTKRIEAYDKVLELVLGLDAIHFEDSGDVEAIAFNPTAFTTYMVDVVRVADNKPWLRRGTAALFREWIVAVTAYYLVLSKTAAPDRAGLSRTAQYRRLRQKSHEIKAALLMDYPHLDDIDQWLGDVKEGLDEDLRRHEANQQTGFH